MTGTVFDVSNQESRMAIDANNGNGHDENAARA
jgi:hypothetical protein